MICCYICGGRMRQAAESGKEEMTADFRCAAIRLYLTVGNFSSHTQWSLTCIDNSAAWAAKKIKCVTTTSQPAGQQNGHLCILGLNKYYFLNNN